MGNRLLRNIAVTIGAGLAVGVGRKLASRQVHPPSPNLSPLLTRIEDIETRMERVELVPSVNTMGPAPEEIEALGTLVSSQSEDIAAIRQDILRIERRNAEQVEAFGQKVALMERQVPAHIDAAVNAKISDLEQKLRGEFQLIHHRTVDAFADTIEKRVVDRILALEHSLDEHSRSIVSLREKSLKTDENLNRLLQAVERLCEKAEAQSQVAIVRTEQAAQPAPAALNGATPHVEPEVHSPAAAPSFAEHYQRALHHEISVEPVLISPPARVGGMKALGMAILGIALVGFRLAR